MGVFEIRLMLPLWPLALIVSLMLILLIFWLWAIIDCLSSKLSGNQKLFWILIIILFNILGALLYLIFSRTGGGIMAKGKFKGKKLLRSKKNRIIAGICGGIGEYLEIDPTVVRLIWVIFTLISFGIGIIAYIIAWIIIPEEK